MGCKQNGLRRNKSMSRPKAVKAYAANRYVTINPLFQDFQELEYLLLGLASVLPAFLIPIFVVGKADRYLNWKDQYWVKASLWIIIFSYVGNYFWTHYFFTVLGASHTFSSWKINNMVLKRIVRRNPQNGNEEEELTSAMREVIANQVLTVLENALPSMLHNFLKTKRERIRKAEQDHEPPMAGALERRCDYKSFKACGPPTYDGTRGAEVVYRWIWEIEAVIRISECHKTKKVNFASSSLVGEALVWVENLRVALGEDGFARLSWNKFKDALMVNFVCEHEKDKVEREFITLEAGSMSHADYTTRFNQISFAPFPSSILNNETS